MEDTPRQQAGRPEDTTGLTLLGVYLAFTLPAAVTAAWHGPSFVIAITHAAALGIVWRLRFGRNEAGRLASFVADWAPLLALPFLYAEIPLLIAGAGTSFQDFAVQRWETRLFGVSPAAALAGALPVRPLSELLHLGYLSYYALIYVPPLLLYARGRREAFHAAISAVAGAYLLCFVIFLLMPVAGPRYQWGAPAGIPDGPMRHLALMLLRAGSARGSAFPSSHVAVAVAQTLIALRTQRPVGLVCAALTILLAVGAVYGGFHYAIDILAGAIVGLGAAGAVVANAREPR